MRNRVSCLCTGCWYHIHPSLGSIMRGTKNLNCFEAADLLQTKYLTIFLCYSVSVFRQQSHTVWCPSVCCSFCMWRPTTVFIGKCGIGWSSQPLKIFSNHRFPPSSPLKPYPKKPSCRKEVIKFPDWNEPKAGTSQEHIPVKSISTVRYPVFISQVLPFRASALAYCLNCKQE